jgi:hypothetical protein
VVTIGDPLGLAVVTCGGYDRRRLAVVAVGFNQERALHTLICWWLWICWCGGSRWVGVDGCGLLVWRLSVGWIVVDLLVQWAAGFLGGGSPVVGCDLCVVCEFSSGYGRL